MLIYIDSKKEIVAYNNIITKEEAQQYIDNTTCLWIDNLEIKYPEYNHEIQKVKMYWNGTSIDYIVENIIEETNDNIKTITNDNLINMDMIVSLDEKLNKIMQHLGI